MQLYKGKGNKSEFCNQRFIHTKEEIPKFFEHILTHKIKPKITENCSKFQIGSISKHQASVHLFSLKSLIGLASIMNIAIIINVFDIRNFFDSENLQDAMNSLFNRGIKGKLYRLVFELNKNNDIQIKTSVGMIKSAETGKNVSQGSISGGLISANSLYDSIFEFFKNSLHEVHYGDVSYQPLIYQDDLARASYDAKSAQFDVDLIENCMETKLKDLHSDKCCYIIVGNKNKELTSYRYSHLISIKSI